MGDLDKYENEEPKIVHKPKINPVNDEELEAIFTKTYGEVKRKKYTPPKKVTYKTTVGKHYRLKCKTYLYKNKKLTGIKFEYLPKTEIIVQKHISASVDMVKVVKTGRVAYINSSNIK